MYKSNESSTEMEESARKSSHTFHILQIMYRLFIQNFAEMH